MDGGAQKLLESVTIRTLHAQNFSRSSTQASLVLTDLLARYLTLLASTCAKYAEHSGRTRLTAKDAVAALDELGVSIEELHEFGTTEGVELNRYALFKSLRRVEDLKEFKAQLSEGLRADTDDLIPLHYGQVPPELEQTLGEEDEEDEEQDASANEDFAMDTSEPFSAAFKRDSIMDDPLSPARKRQRTMDWDPPEHVPSFFPPFPSTTHDSPPPSSPHSPRILPTDSLLHPLQGAGIEKPPTPPPVNPPQQAIASTSAAASDYLVQVPYSQSSISSVSEWHLPSSQPSTALSRPEPRWPTPATEPSLIVAYHDILTHPTPSSAQTANPQRHKVAMALLALTQSTPRWDLPDTLFSNLVTNQPRTSSIGPTYPVLIGDPPATEAGKKDKDFKFPSTAPRSVASTERISQLVSQQGSRIPELARHVLPPAILSRATRLTHPPPLSRNNKVLTYGVGIPAPWNANTLPTENANAAPNNTNNTKDSKKEPPPVLPDARLFATWDHEHKDFRVPLAPSKPQRARLGSVLGSSNHHHGSVHDLERKPSAGTISLGAAARNRASSRVG
ncbi:hypothetical protein GYMLUDRAFT_249360 [Collybiopsis luxurians FD-317 M1]|uniref:Bromodomain associated domain-containing protein n=1 Tax=Collybiopsis luxurians FD-317 M1 TaxID=944289 RepID=A0A0D0CI63_9AGAR|nr:hypothetical protein GYMLUDRAFT_249360 [Collybiopsis luxurians FD-317 M1]